MKRRYAAVDIAVATLSVAAIVRHAKAWPRLAPGTRCMIIGEDSQGLSIIVRLDSSIGKFYESGPGTRVIVADDISGSLFDPLRMVRVNLGRADVLKTVERKNLAIMR